MKTEKVLMENGLSMNEAKAYISLLRVGEATAGRIADISRIHRANAYSAMDRLVERGMASHHVRRKKKMYTATAPERLLKIVHDKELSLRKILPRLRLEKEMSEVRTVAEVVEGQRAVRSVVKENDWEVFEEEGVKMMVGVNEVCFVTENPYIAVRVKSSRIALSLRRILR